MANLLVAALVVAAASRPGPGEKAPSFTLDSSAGKPVSLREIHGRSAVLAFFPKAFTAG